MIESSIILGFGCHIYLLLQILEETCYFCNNEHSHKRFEVSTADAKSLQVALSLPAVGVDSAFVFLAKYSTTGVDLGHHIS